jgi:hypothetical protein
MRGSRFARHGEISVAVGIRSLPSALNLTVAVTMSGAPNRRVHAAGGWRLKIETNSILSNLMKNRVAFALILSKTLPSSPTAASSLSARV